MRASSSSPSACSGLMYATVPNAEPGEVWCSALTPSVAPAVTQAGSKILLRWPVTLANPKSRIFVCLRSVTNMFAGLISR